MSQKKISIYDTCCLPLFEIVPANVLSTQLELCYDIELVGVMSNSSMLMAFYGESYKLSKLSEATFLERNTYLKLELLQCGG